MNWIFFFKKNLLYQWLVVYKFIYKSASKSLDAKMIVQYNEML